MRRFIYIFSFLLMGITVPAVGAMSDPTGDVYWVGTFENIWTHGHYGDGEGYQISDLTGWIDAPGGRWDGCPDEGTGYTLHCYTDVFYQCDGSITRLTMVGDVTANPNLDYRETLYHECETETEW